MRLFGPDVPVPLAADFGQLLREARLDLARSYAEQAIREGASQNTIRRREEGHGLERLLRLLQLLADAGWTADLRRHKVAPALDSGRKTPIA